MAFASCGSHISTLDPVEPAALEVEAGLVAYLVVLIVSEYESYLEAAFADRAAKCGDPHVSNYVRNELARTFRSPDLGKLNKTLGSFGQDYLTAFKAQVENTRQHASWDNIMRARHYYVHRQGASNITFRELKTSYGDTLLIIEELARILGI